MATKDQMRSELLKLEPNNEIALNEVAGHADLKTELTAAKRRATTKKSSEAVQVIATFRTEDGERLSWKLIDRSTGEQLGLLMYGDQVPLVGELITIDKDTNSYARVSSHADGLKIMAGDLPIREEFDERRIYNTPSGTSVVFMRYEHDRVVLWSYKIQSEIMVGSHVELIRTERTAQPVANKKRKMTQKILAAYVIAQNPDITGKQLTIALMEAFPSANISPDGRHGPHYLSLSRNGKLPVAPDEDPRTW